MSDKKYTSTVFIVIVIIVLIVVLGFIMGGSGESNVVVTDFDECVARGYPVLESYPRQCKTPGGETFTEDIGNELEKADLIRVESPRPNSLVNTNPVHITGVARGNWFFEASFPIKVLDSTGKIVGTGYATALDEWMTTNFVPFEAVVRLTEYGIRESQTKGTIILEKDNPSSLPENADELRIPVKFPARDEVSGVQVYFGHKDLDDTNCENVKAVEHGIAPKQAPAAPTLVALLAGPAPDEIQDGFFTSIPKSVKIQSLEIKNGVAYADFSKELEEGVGGSCRVINIRSQIMKTLLQFPTITGVVISIDGRTEDILQP